MIRTKDPSQRLQLQAEMIRSALPAKCRKEGRSPKKTMSIASKLIYHECVQGNPSKPCSPDVEEAKNLIRLERTIADPSWLEKARKQYEASLLSRSDPVVFD